MFSDELKCVFTGELSRDGGEYIIEVPRGEIENGFLNGDETYRVALLNHPVAGSNQQSQQPHTDTDTDDGQQFEKRQPVFDEQEPPEERTPPVSEGEQLSVDITDEGEEGDGMARVDGFVVIVPGGTKGEKVVVEITNVKDNVAFSEIIGTN